MGNAQRWARITSRTSPSSSPLLVQRSFFFAAKRFALRSFLSFPQRMHHSSPHASHRHAVARSAASRPATAWCQQLQRALGEGWESLLLGELWRAARGLVEPAHPKLTSSFNHTSIPGSMLKVTHAEFFGVLGFGATSASSAVDTTLLGTNRRESRQPKPPASPSPYIQPCLLGFSVETSHVRRMQATAQKA